jgi:O-methyltransferase
MNTRVSNQIEIPLGIITAFKSNDSIRNLYNASIERSQKGAADNLLKQLRFYVLHQLAATAARTFPTLNFAECGCWWGHSTHILSEILLADSNFVGRLHVFDSFEGLSEFKTEDHSEFRSTQSLKDRARKNFRADLTRVAESLKHFPFVSIHPGWVPSKFCEVENDKFAFVSIDLDLYEPIRDSVKFFYPRLQEGGLMYFDDYGYETFPGAKRAVDEYLVTVSPSFFLALPFGSAFLIK